MAEALGAAVLTVSVDDTALRAGLAAAQQEAQRAAAGIDRAFQSLGGGLASATGDLRAYREELERLAKLPGPGQGRPLQKPPLPPPIPQDLLRPRAAATPWMEAMTAETERLREASARQAAVADTQAASMQRLGSAAAVASAGFESVAGVLGRLGLATSVAGVAAFVGSQITELDKAAAAVRTLGVDADDLKARLRNLSVELDNNVSQVDLTKAAYDVASSGFADAASATDILRAAALGARGGFADINDVARALTGVLNAYGLEASKATFIVDQFIQTQADGVLTVRQYANEIGNVSSIAAAAGISLGELNAVIATATLRGVPVQQTFTGLRQAISSILKPSQQAAELARTLGIDFSVSALKAKGLGGVLADIQAKGGGAADQLAILLGSVEAQAAVQPLLNDRLVKFNELLAKQANAAGEAGKASDVNSQTISAGLERIGVGFSNLATTLDSTLGPVLKGLLNDINEVLLKLNQVAALSPDRVRQREQEATRIVERAAANSESSTVRAFFGTPLVGAVEIKYGGKVYKGTVTGIRNDILNDLLQKDLAAQKEPPKQGPPVPPRLRPQVRQGRGAATPQDDGPKADPAAIRREVELIQSRDAIEEEGIRARIAGIVALSKVQGRAREELQSQLSVEEKLRGVRKAQQALDREMAKPTGVNKEGETRYRDEAKAQALMGDLNKANLQVDEARAEAAARRVERAREEAKIAREYVEQQRQAIKDTQRGRADTLRDLNRQISDAQSGASTDPLQATARLQDQLGRGIQDAAITASRAARDLEESRRRQVELFMRGQRPDLAGLAKLQADADVAGKRLELAAANAGQALRDNAKEAAKSLTDAISSRNSTLRGNFELLTRGRQLEQIELARQEVQAGVARGDIRSDVRITDISQLFSTAAFANQTKQADEQLKLAQRLKDSADAAAANTGQLFDNSVAMATLARGMEGLIAKQWAIDVSVAANGTATVAGDANLAYR